MKHSSRWLVAGLIGVSLQFAACQRHTSTHQAQHPVQVEKIDGTEINRVTMTEKAAERLALKTDEVREQKVSRSTGARKVVPHSSVIYDPTGATWVYTSPKPHTFVKHRVDIEYVEGDLAVLNDGPPTGTVVVSTAAAEVYGADAGVGH